MAMYEYRCPFCNLTYMATSRGDSNPCPICNRSAKRNFRFAIQPSFQDGYTPTTGGYVASEHDLKEQLKRKSDELTNRNGIEHRLVPVDFRDMDACGVTKEGMAENQEIRVKQQEAKTRMPADLKLEIRNR